MPIGNPFSRLNKVKASGGCHRFSEEIYRAELDKIWAQITQGAFYQGILVRECSFFDHFPKAGMDAFHGISSIHDFTNGAA
ncbi:hypothetical protein J6TS1_06120 [Siminovitchia terrae]|uniref:Uncharacterized protein n=1 Tax=Siminovitchia terrae TaxID=1914933 RepID=A0ABQ4KRS7_SIMTE|nr:hypothetical protein J6TS1_06120 [Siminovitchia terrae]